MGNRAVITERAEPDAPCIYLHWNGGWSFVKPILDIAHEFGIDTLDTEVERIDALAKLFALAIGTEVDKLTVYRQKYGEADQDNGDNGTYLIGGRHRYFASPIRLFAPKNENAWGSYSAWQIRRHVFSVLFQKATDISLAKEEAA